MGGQASYQPDSFLRSVTGSSGSLMASVFLSLPLDRPGLRGTDEIAKLNEAVGRSLLMELDKTHRYPVKGDVTVYAFLIAKMPALR